MASVFSSHDTSLHYSSNRNAQLTQSPRADHRFHPPHYFPDSISTIELIRLLIAMIGNPLIRNAHHLFMERRRMTPAHP
jgi:hypothetical protein